MNRERAKELLPIIQAFAEGKDIQCKNQHGNWNDNCASNPFFEDYAEWRIKPEKEVIYVNKRIDRQVPLAFSNRRDALLSVPLSCPEKYEYIAKKFIEVINEE